MNAIAFPRRGIADETWRYRKAVETDVARTFRAERARLKAEADKASAAAATAKPTTAPAAHDGADIPLPLPGRVALLARKA